MRDRVCLQQRHNRNCYPQKITSLYYELYIQKRVVIVAELLKKPMLMFQSSGFVFVALAAALHAFFSLSINFLFYFSPYILEAKRKKEKKERPTNTRRCLAKRDFHLTN